MRGHLLLECAKDSVGKTYLARQSFCAPMYLNKPYWEGNYLIINAINPTAGLFPGDSIDLSLHAGEETRVVFTSPSASRIHRGRKGVVRVNQHFEVGAGAWLDVFPELLIPQRDSHYVQETQIHLKKRAGIFFTEMMAPGRVAFKEAFVFKRMEMRTSVCLEGTTIALDHYQLAPQEYGIPALQARYRDAYYAACFLFADILPPSLDLRRLIGQTSDSRAMAAASSFSEGLMVMRIIAADSIALKRIIAAIRALIYGAIGNRLPILRKQ